MDDKIISTLSHILSSMNSTLFPTNILEMLIDLKHSDNLTEEKINRAYASLKETSKVIDELENVLKKRAKKLEVLHEEYDRYSKLTELKEEDVKSLLEQLEISIEKRKNRERWASLIISLIAGIIIFLFGILLGPTIKTMLGIGG